MRIDTYHDLTELALNDMNRWLSQEKVLEKTRDALILTLKNLMHFEKNAKGEFVGVDEDEKPKYLMTDIQLNILYDSEKNIMTMLKEVTDELLELSKKMQNTINKKSEKNRVNLDMLDSILKQREVF